ncbi:MAG: DUF2339 domain-containing protein [Desulfobacteraceae bacterium]|nr:DUF2339 domain-containing protein [Desulfobacteraceae bacterium]
MVYLVLGGIGWLMGAVTYRNFGWFFGLVLGLMAAEIFALRKRIASLEKSRTATTPRDKATTARVYAEAEPEPPVPHAVQPLEVSRPVRPKAPPVVAEPVTAPRQSPKSGKDRPPGMSARLVQYLKEFFTTGNVVTKIGVIVLFFGFAFLLKYAARHTTIPIEFRLIGVVLCGLGMIVAGWRLREPRKIYAMLLQGCGVGVLYLTVYAAARFYHLLPYGFSFAVMFCLVILSGILAVLQDARALAVSGIIGGFLAPVLMSTGSGSHVALFSYYALLDLGIVGIAWHRAWRELNLIGFVFTFGIASLWGGRYYQPLYFSTTEPFLILFFLFYVAISVFHALRQPMNLKGYVDGTLVFGVPLVAFGLQYGLVRDFEYGLAISALGLGLFYILLAAFLWRRRVEGLRMVTESFLAFGVVFGSLAIPLALDGRWTSAAWALEGGAILWIGTRQNRLLPRIFGILLQAGSGISFMLAMDLPSRQIPLVNSVAVGCILISLAGLFSSWYLAKRSGTISPRERPIGNVLMIWGLAWWFGAAFLEIHRFVAWQDRVSAALIHGAVSFMVTDLVSRRLDWKQFAYPPIMLLPVMVVAGLIQPDLPGRVYLFTPMGFVAWAIVFLVQYRLLFNCEKRWPQKLVPLWHQCTLWLLIFILTRESSHGITLLLQEGQTWQYCVWGVLPGTAVLLILTKGDRLSWPIRRFHQAYFEGGTAVPMVFLLAWVFLVNRYHADPAPLPFIPVVNPMEITQLYILFLALLWNRHHKEWIRRLDINREGPVLKFIFYMAGFLLLNAMVARTIHFHAQVPYTASGLYRSVLFQAAISILWGVTALVTTLAATRKGSRPAWFTGVSILSLVVIKLFVVDLAGTGTLARIVSFLGVGSLMLLIGYFSPLSPARTKEDS